MDDHDVAAVNEMYKSRRAAHLQQSNFGNLKPLPLSLPTVKEMATASRTALIFQNVPSKPQTQASKKMVTQAQSENSGDPVADFDAAVRSRLPRGRSATLQERQAAIALVARMNPRLHQAMLEAQNPGAYAQRMIREKYDAQ